MILLQVCSGLLKCFSYSFSLVGMYLAHFETSTSIFITWELTEAGVAVDFLNITYFNQNTKCFIDYGFITIFPVDTFLLEGLEEGTLYSVMVEVNLIGGGYFDTEISATTSSASQC